MSEERPGEAFGAELARLKRRGSASLVLSAREAVGVCRDLLGSESEPRRRVLVRADEFGWLPVPGDDPVVVDATADDSRSAAAYDPGPVDRRLAGGPTVDTVSTGVQNEVERLAEEGLDPAELRVCLGRLDPMLERTDAGSIEGPLRSVFDAVRSAGGMGHVHLSRDADPSTVERLRPLFDVTLEVRSTPGGICQQRWRLHDAGIDTGWLQMEAR